jgi:alkylated DNA nucleotide flippase Atl1
MTIPQILAHGSVDSTVRWHRVARSQDDGSAVADDPL